MVFYVICKLIRYYPSRKVSFYIKFNDTVVENAFRSLDRRIHIDPSPDQELAETLAETAEHPGGLEPNGTHEHTQQEMAVQEWHSQSNTSLPSDSVYTQITTPTAVRNAQNALSF